MARLSWVGWKQLPSLNGWRASRGIIGEASSLLQHERFGGSNRAVAKLLSLYQDLSGARSSASSRRPIAVQWPAAVAGRENVLRAKIPCFSALGIDGRTGGVMSQVVGCLIWFV